MITNLAKQLVVNIIDTAEDDDNKIRYLIFIEIYRINFC